MKLCKVTYVYLSIHKTHELWGASILLNVFRKLSQVLTELNVRAVGSFDLRWDVLSLSVLSYLAVAGVADRAMFSAVQPLLSLNSSTDLTAVSCLTLMNFSSLSTTLKREINSVFMFVSNCVQRLLSVCYSSSAWVPNPRAARLYNSYPTAFPYGNGMVLHFYQQQESSTTKTVHKVINKRLKTYA